jgi:hypothetical protein
VGIVLHKEKNGLRSVQLVKTVKKKGAKYPTSIVLHTFGCYERLVEDDPDILEKLRATYASDKGSFIVRHAIEADGRLIEEYGRDFGALLLAKKEHLDDPFKEERPYVESSVLNIGHLLLDKVFRQLGLDEFFAGIGEGRNNGFDLAEAVRMLAFSRILFPDSILQTQRKRGSFLGGFDIKLIESYRALDYVFACGDELQEHLFRTTCRLFGFSPRDIYLDETNYYFCIDVASGIKQNGPSKENKLSPIVQFALMIDANGIPIISGTFAGNAKDSRCLPPLYAKIKDKFIGGAGLTVIADKGSNCAGNAILLDKGGDFYVFSQRVKGAAADFVSWALDSSGYVWRGEGYKSKERIVETDYRRLEKNEAGKYRTAEERRIREKQVAFWSADYAAFEAARRKANVKKSEAILDNIGLLAMGQKRGGGRYVKAEKPEGQSYSLDSEKISSDERCEGYYAVITNAADLTMEEVLAKYRRLNFIEERFRITKSLFRVRPIYLSTENHIIAHLLLSHVCLTIVTYIRERIRRAAGRSPEEFGFSFERIIEALRRLEVVRLDDAHYKINRFDLDMLMITKAFDVFLVKNIYTADQLKKVFS